MKLGGALLAVSMAVVAAAVPLAVSVWGLWSLPTITLTVAVLCFEVMLGVVLSQHSRRQINMTRFGIPLQHNHFPIHHGPLPGGPTPRRRPSAHQGTVGARRGGRHGGTTTPTPPAD